HTRSDRDWSSDVCSSDLTAEALHVAASDVLVCSTGIIGTPLPMEPILSHAPKLAKKLSVEGADDAARGILTTDHKTKQVVIKGRSEERRVGKECRSRRAE